MDAFFNCLPAVAHRAAQQRELLEAVVAGQLGARREARADVLDLFGVDVLEIDVPHHQLLAAPAREPLVLVRERGAPHADDGHAVGGKAEAKKMKVVEAIALGDLRDGGAAYGNGLARCLKHSSTEISSASIFILRPAG
ncbi:ORF150 [Saltwater crocodilepox virus]|nr:hypothetical protein [Saltwater crocodilepox virus]AVD69485.1 hypothetical protein [Saltwater crocodilepox virus]QGT46588.1 ORF150 [Saltwater crocodilepox virus]QGT46804.1 ORF150 [Saltwater crocodilepox virus]QGT47020.1 ORF150 [Saltwater crocodilepox virus]